MFLHQEPLAPKGKARSERGAIIPLVALLTAIFFIFAAIVIDLNLLASSREQTQHYARLAALAAINAHFSSPATTIQGQLADALAAAQAVSDSNVILSDLSGPSSQAQMTTPGGDEGAVLTPGIWYFEDDGSGTVCQGDGDDNLPPCFIPTDLTSADAQVTAYRINGALYQGITTAVARRLDFMGKEAFDVQVEAVASVIPRHGCFIIDLSGSMIRDTHPRRTTLQEQTDPLGGRGREFAFVLESENPLTTPEDFYHTESYNFLCTGEFDEDEKETAPPAPAACTAQLRPTTVAEWNSFLAPYGRTFDSLTELERRRVHFHDDYLRKKTFGNRHWDDNAIWQELHPDPSDSLNYEVNDTDDGQFYRIDVDPTGEAIGPEPLRTVFAGLNEAMRTFRSRRVAGDEACLIFYDNKLAWPRVVNLTNNFDYLVNLTDFSKPNAVLPTDPIGFTSDSLTISDADLTDLSNQRGLELIIRHGLFPSGPQASFTNTGLAISEAMNQLTNRNSTGGFSSDFIVSIGDGLGNCSDCLDLNNNLIPGCTIGCQNDYTNYSIAQDNLLTFIKREIAPRNIPIHQILVGQSVAPHSLNIAKDADGTCMSDIEFRRAAEGKSFVRGGFDTTAFSDLARAYSGANPDHPFYEASVTPYEIASGTRGLWGPIRPGGADCTPIDTCTGDIDNLDAAPRILQDPECRTTDQQIRDYMAKIIGDNPYTLVFVGTKG